MREKTPQIPISTLLVISNVENNSYFIELKIGMKCELFKKSSQIKMSWPEKSTLLNWKVYYSYYTFVKIRIEFNPLAFSKLKKYTKRDKVENMYFVVR